VGMIRIFRDNINSSLNDLKMNIKGSFTIVTGTSAYNEIAKAAEVIMKINPKIRIHVKKIINNFFGETITVAGLITGKDIIEQLKYENTGKYVIIPDCMLRKGYEIALDNKRVFLDDITVEELGVTLDREVLVCDYTGEDLIKIINKHCEEE
jgi:NifB/MoaA-like Fe-S oxidoreductase